MPITVKVIFLGLIGFVPGPEGKNDVAALLVDPIRTQVHHAQCHVPEHDPVVFLLHGTCDEGACIKPGGGLMWHLHEDDLDIVGDEGNELDLAKPNFLMRLIQGNAPRSLKQSSYFSWVPDMHKLTSGHGQLEDKCLSAGLNCRLHARFRIQGGDIGVCHLFHELETSKDEERNVRIFNYVTTDGQHFRRAVADAVQVEFQVEGERVHLRSKELPKRPPHSTEAWLKPEQGKPGQQGKVTLIVANLPRRRTGEGMAPTYETYSRSHSEVFFGLLRDEKGPRSVRIMSDDKRRTNPGSCEPEISELDTNRAFSEGRELPHAATACDGTRFPKPTQ